MYVCAVLDDEIVNTLQPVLYYSMYVCFDLGLPKQTRKLLFSKLAIYLTDDNNFF